MGAPLHCGTWTFHCSGFSCCRSQALKLSSCGMRTQLLQGTWNHPGPRIKPLSPPIHWQADSHPLYHQGSPQFSFYCNVFVQLQHQKKKEKKICIVKAMVFPVVMYGYESWIIKKVEHQRIEAFELWCWRRLLRVQGDQTSQS